MQRLKFIRSLCLLSTLILAILPSIATAQNPTMRLDINPNIPTTNPYCDGNYPSFSYTPGTDNARICPDVPDISDIGNDVVDWILLELRAVDNSGGSTAYTDASEATLIARKPAFLLSNGRIVDAADYAGGSCSSGQVSGIDQTDDATNCPDVVFDDPDLAAEIEGKDLYLVIRHRNHVDMISNTPLTPADSSGAYTYDFSRDANQAGGANSLKLVQGVFAMPGGDADGNGRLQLDDYTAFIRADQIANRRGYLASDTDMNTRPQLDDYTVLVRENQTANIRSRVP